MVLVCLVYSSSVSTDFTLVLFSPCAGLIWGLWRYTNGQWRKALFSLSISFRVNLLPSVLSLAKFPPSDRKSVV